MARTLWLYNLYRALCTAHLHKFLFVFVFLARGISLDQVMLLQMIFSAAVLLLEIPTGAWADRIGRRRSMGLGALLMACASVGYFFAHSFGVLALCEFTFAAGLTMTSGADSAYLYDQLKAAGRADEYLRRESAASAAKYIGLAIAAVAGGTLAWLHSPETTFLITAGTSFSAFLLTFFFPATEGRPRLTKEAMDGPELGDRVWEGLSTIRRNPAICWVLLYSALLFTLIRSSDTLFQPVVKNQGFNWLGLGLVFAGLNFVGAAAALRVGRLDWRKWQESILWLLPILLVICYLFIGVLGPVIVVGLMLAHYVVTGVYSPVVKTLINQEMPDSRVRATVLSAESAAKRLVLLFVWPVLSVVFRATGGSNPDGGAPSTESMRPVLLVCCGIALLALLTRYLHYRQKFGPRSATASGLVESRGVPDRLAAAADTGSSSAMIVD